MCPECPTFYRLLANVYINYYWFDSSKSPQESIEKAKELLQKTLAMDEDNADAHGNLSIVYLQKREYDKAIAEGERAVTLDPGSPWRLSVCQGSRLSAGRRKPFRCSKKPFDSTPLPRRLSIMISASLSDSLDDWKKRLRYIKSHSSVPRTIFGFMRAWRLSIL